MGIGRGVRVGAGTGVGVCVGLGVGVGIGVKVGVGTGVSVGIGVRVGVGVEVGTTTAAMGASVGSNMGAGAVSEGGGIGVSTPLPVPAVFTAASKPLSKRQSCQSRIPAAIRLPKMKTPNSDAAPIAIHRRAALGLRSNPSNQSLAGTRKTNAIPRPVASQNHQGQTFMAAPIKLSDILAVTIEAMTIRTQRIGVIGCWNSLLPGK